MAMDFPEIGLLGDYIGDVVVATKVCDVNVVGLKAGKFSFDEDNWVDDAGRRTEISSESGSVLLKLFVDNICGRIVFIVIDSETHKITPFLRNSIISACSGLVALSPVN